MKIDLLNSIGRVHCIAHSWAYSRPIHAHTVALYTNTQYSTFLADRSNGREHIGGEANAVPYTQQALTQLDDVIYAFLVDPLLHYSLDLIIHGVHIWAVWGPLVGRNSLASLGVKVRLCHAPCVQVHCPVGIWNCHRIFPWCMAAASPSAVRHDNSHR